MKLKFTCTDHQDPGSTYYYHPHCLTLCLISSLKATFQDVSSGSGQGRVLPSLPQHHQHLLDNPPLTSLELKNMGRDTIAGLIAGILEKYSKKGEVSVFSEARESQDWLC